jgi:hypothetical protein
LDGGPVSWRYDLSFPNPEKLLTFLFYLDLNQELKTTLIEEYSAEKEPDDGEIYSKIREYQGYRGAGNPYFEKRWWARLAAISDHKKENLERVFRNTDYRAAFDVQLDVPGLAGGMRLGTTHTMFAMKCHEVSSISASSSKVLTILNSQISTISMILLGTSGPRRSSAMTQRQCRK